MKLKDFNLLKKFMALTMSDNEHECLTALRQANSVLKKDGLTWDQVLDRSLRINEPEVEAAPESYDDHTPRRSNPYAHGNSPVKGVIADAFEKINNSNIHSRSGTFKYTIDNIEKQWLSKGSLSEKQKDLVLKTASCIDEDGNYTWRQD